MKATIPYLFFPGTTAEAFQFYQKALGGKLSMTKFRDSPMGERATGPDADAIFHAELHITNSLAIMASDSCGESRAKLTRGNNVTICLDAESEAEAQRVFRALSEGGSVSMPMQKVPWAAAFGTCSDRFGIEWMINYSVPGAAH